MDFIVDQSVVRVDLEGRRPALRVTVDGRRHEVALQKDDGGDLTLEIDGVSHHCVRFSTAHATWLRIFGRTFVFARPPSERERIAGGGALDVLADMPGVIVAVHVEEGTRVTTGEPLLTLESMKLYTTVNADRDAEIGRIHLRAGDTFERGASLLSYRAPQASSAGEREETP
jgi:biotin carboxyl carrier protein